MLESFFNKVPGFSPIEPGPLICRANQWTGFYMRKACNLILKRLQHRCFPVNIAKFLRTPNLKNTCDRLLFKLIVTPLLISWHEVLCISKFAGWSLKKYSLYI